MRVAIVHDWLVTYAGSERVVAELLALYPRADLFSLIDFLPRSDRRHLLGKTARTTFLQRMPLVRKHYAAYLPLFPIAIEQLNLSGYHLVLSSSHCVAKGVLTGPDQLHVSYVHTPMRYAWDSQHESLEGSSFGRGLRGIFARWMLHKLRLWDARTAAGVDSFVANSRFIARRIWKTYRRHAEVIYPPVDTTLVPFDRPREDFYLTVSRLVPYKRVDLLLEAFARMPGRRLVVIGDGPQRKRLQRLAGNNVTLLGHQSSEVVRDYLSRARGFVFAAREDFGIALAEAQAAGTPVIAFGQGGAREIVRDVTAPRPTGVLFGEQTPEALTGAIERFEQHASSFTGAACRDNAARFSVDRFRRELSEHIARQWERFQSGTWDADSDERDSNEPPYLRVA